MNLRSGAKHVMILAATLFALAGSVSAQDMREITLAMPSKSLVASAPRIAQEMGIFAKHGISPVLSYVDTTAGTATALLSGSVEFAETGVAEVVAAKSRGQSLVIVANHYRGLSGSLVLSKAVADRLGISPEASPSARLAALDGLLIASTSATSSFTISYKGAVEAAGADPRFTYMAINAMGAALKSGAIDGAIMTAPFWAFPVLEGSAILWISPPKGEMADDHVPSSAAITATTLDFAEANPEVVTSVAAVFNDLSVAFAERPDEVRAAIARLFPDVNAEALNLALSLESGAFATQPLTSSDISRDIDYMKTGGGNFGPIETVDPASVLPGRQ